VALPVFKIGCFPLAGEAGFDSQALPPHDTEPGQLQRHKDTELHRGSLGGDGKPKIRASVCLLVSVIDESQPREFMQYRRGVAEVLEYHIRAG
jgi:hypothetical protein